MNSRLLFLLLSFSFDAMQSKHQCNPPIIHPLQIYSRLFCCHCAVPNRLWLQMLLRGRVIKGFALLYQHQYSVYLFCYINHQYKIYLLFYINTNVQYTWSAISTQISRPGKISSFVKIFFLFLAPQVL